MPLCTWSVALLCCPWLLLLAHRCDWVANYTSLTGKHMCIFLSIQRLQDVACKQFSNLSVPNIQVTLQMQFMAILYCCIMSRPVLAACPWWCMLYVTLTNSQLALQPGSLHSHVTMQLEMSQHIWPSSLECHSIGDAYSVLFCLQIFPDILLV